MCVGEHYNVNERERRRTEEEEPCRHIYARALALAGRSHPGERARFLLRAL